MSPRRKHVLIRESRDLVFRVCSGAGGFVGLVYARGCMAAISGSRRSGDPHRPINFALALPDRVDPFGGRETSWRPTKAARRRSALRWRCPATIGVGAAPLSAIGRSSHG
jgi:hypothetical protein